jgi:hypothetical protein
VLITIIIIAIIRINEINSFSFAGKKARRMTLDRRLEATGRGGATGEAEREYNMTGVK